MKKILSLCLALLLLVSAVPMAQATTAASNGTTITAAGTKSEAYTVTVPAALAPGQTGNVTANGSWAANKTLKVTCPTSVHLYNGSDKMTVGVTFTGLQLAGDNVDPIAATSAVITIATVDTSAFFGTWTGTLTYSVEMVTEEASAAMYSYNGVVLPNINTVWTDELKQQYPFAIIWLYNDEYVLDLVSAVPSYVTINEEKENPISIEFGTNPTYLFYNQNNGSWVFNDEYTDDISTSAYPNIAWVSTDLSYYNGTVYMATSAPIPVYE